MQLKTNLIINLQNKKFFKKNESMKEWMRYKKKMSRAIDFNDLTYYFKSPDFSSINFIGFKGPLNIHEKIKNSNISIKKEEEDQKQFKSNINEITSGNPKHREKYKSDARENIRNLYNTRKKVIDLFNDYAKLRSEAMYWKLCTVPCKTGDSN